MVCIRDTKETNTYMNNYKPMITKTVKVHTRYNRHKITKEEETIKVDLSDE